MTSSTSKTAALGAAFLLTVGLTVFVTTRVTRERLGVASAVPSSSVAAGGPASVRVVTNVLTEAFDWRKVESADYRTYVANLRAIGCPEETIRDIITADVNKLFAARHPLIPEGLKFEYWTATNALEAFFQDGRAVERMQEIARQKHEILKTLLGTDVPETTERPDPDQVAAIALGFLPAAKRAQLQQVEEMFDARWSQARGAGAPDLAAYQALDRIAAEKDAAVAKLLTPEEKIEYDLRMSLTANRLRNELADFGPTEQEFRQIFPLQQKYDQKIGTAGEIASDEASSQSRGAARDELQQQLKTILGDERFEQYLRSQDPAYQIAVRIAQRQGLPDSTAADVYRIKSDLENQLLALSNDPSLSPAQRAAQEDSLRSAAQRAVSDKLGADGFASYKSNPSVFWLQAAQGTAAR